MYNLVAKTHRHDLSGAIDGDHHDKIAHIILKSYKIEFQWKWDKIWFLENTTTSAKMVYIILERDKNLVWLKMGPNLSSWDYHNSEKNSLHRVRSVA